MDFVGLANGVLEVGRVLGNYQVRYLDGLGDWALAQRDIIARKCPTTLKTALRLVREGGTGVEARDGLKVVRVLEQLQQSLA